jgi:hypothetical protein
VITLKQLAALVLLMIGFTGCAYEGPVAPGPQPYMYDYYYYPSSRVYFNIHSGYYDYYMNGRWFRSLALPPTIYLSPRDRHHFQSREAKPFQHDHRNREHYRPIPDMKHDREQDHRARDFDRKSHEQYKGDHDRRR